MPYIARSCELIRRNCTCYAQVGGHFLIISHEFALVEFTCFAGGVQQRQIKGESRSGINLATNSLEVE